MNGSKWYSGYFRYILLIFFLIIPFHTVFGQTNRVEENNSKPFLGTYYWTVSPEPVLNPTDQLVSIRDRAGDIIAFNIPLKIVEQIIMEGSGFLPETGVLPAGIRGKLINVNDSKPLPDARFEIVNKNYAPWGLDSRGNSLIPYYSIAADPEILPYGTLVYIKEFDGYKLPTGFTTIDGEAVHNGKFRVCDIGSLINDYHIDIFVGSKDNYLETGPVISQELILSVVPSYMIDTSLSYTLENKDSFLYQWVKKIRGSGYYNKGITIFAFADFFYRTLELGQLFPGVFENYNQFTNMLMRTNNIGDNNYIMKFGETLIVPVPVVIESNM